MKWLTFAPWYLSSLQYFANKLTRGDISVNFYKPEGIFHLASKRLQRATGVIWIW